MPRKVRDFGITVVVLTILFGILWLTSPLVREHVTRISGQTQTQGWQSSAGPISNAAMGALAITSGFAGDNPVMFAFMIVAVVLFVFMVKVS